tara:strand:- start:71 stop:265 length:195 start_codon:yes stop_codon:yes gene_type:complete
MKINDNTKWSDIDKDLSFLDKHFIQVNNDGLEEIIEDSSVRICSLEFIDTGCGEQMFNVEIERK